MAIVTTWNKGSAPAGSNGWLLTPDIRAALESMNVVVPVANKTERDAITPPLGKYIGMAVSRADANGLIEIWNGSIWRAPSPLGQIGTVLSAGANVVGTSLNNMLEAFPVVEASRLIEVRAAIDGSSSANGLYCSYSLAYGGTGVAGTVLRTSTKAYTTAALGEGFEFTTRFTTVAAGSLRFNLQGQVTVTAGTMTATTGNARLTITDMGPA